VWRIALRLIQKGDAMKEQNNGRASSEGGPDWARLRALSYEEIRRALDEDPEVRAKEGSFWEKAKLVLRQTKETRQF
jgi:hypothetical protein